LGSWDECIEILGTDDRFQYPKNLTDITPLEASVALLRGKAYAGLENKHG
jgi:hypothetical protein